jgi:hypothetical protein
MFPLTTAASQFLIAAFTRSCSKITLTVLFYEVALCSQSNKESGARGNCNDGQNVLRLCITVFIHEVQICSLK